MRFLCWALVVLACVVCIPAQQAGGPSKADPLQALDFLVGTWAAQTNGAGGAGATASGTYTFRRDLGGHVLERISSTSACKGPADFDCQHSDQLTIFSEGARIAALYLDSEGHVIRYMVSTPNPHTAVFLSEGPAEAPRFRLMYHLEGSGSATTMKGSFEGAAPRCEPNPAETGNCSAQNDTKTHLSPQNQPMFSTEFHTYLQWSGPKL